MAESTSASLRDSKTSLVLSARDDLKNSFWVPEFHKSLRMKFDHKLMNSLKSDAQPFSKFTAPHWPVQNIE
jgi:hypothetical protein